LEIIKPKGVITMGKYSTSKFMDMPSMGQVQGKMRKAEWSDGSPYLVMPIYHPAFLVRAGKEEEGKSIEFLKRFREATSL